MLYRLWIQRVAHALAQNEVGPGDQVMRTARTVRLDTTILRPADHQRRSFDFFQVFLSVARTIQRQKLPTIVGLCLLFPDGVSCG